MTNTIYARAPGLALTEGQFYTLVALAAHEKAWPGRLAKSADIARFLKVTPKQVLDRFESLSAPYFGLVKLRTVPKAAVLVRLTEKGQQVLAALELTDNGDRGLGRMLEGKEWAA